MGRKEIIEITIQELRNKKMRINTCIFAMIVLGIPLGMICIWFVSMGVNHWIAFIAMCFYIAFVVFLEIQKNKMQYRIIQLIKLQQAIQEAKKRNKIIPITKSERYLRNRETKNLKAR